MMLLGIAQFFNRLLWKWQDADRFRAAELTKFEEEIEQLFIAKKIFAPIHLRSGNELQLVKIFKKIKRTDWVLCTWSSHLECLLHGVPPEELKREILAGKSISICLPKYKVISSAIVGGTFPIAVGLGLAAKRLKKKEKVWCFVGDMGSETGAFYEALKYVTYNRLPVIFVIGDNGKSVCTNTNKVWGTKRNSWAKLKNPHVIYYKYQNMYTHSGTRAGRINF
jgi:TPP-dependent pyruvate/acetoin dehydrogenase alpha subunit